jgi:hypothetical protein
VAPSRRRQDERAQGIPEGWHTRSGISSLCTQQQLALRLVHRRFAGRESLRRLRPQSQRCESSHASRSLTVLGEGMLAQQLKRRESSQHCVHWRCSVKRWSPGGLRRGGPKNRGCETRRAMNRLVKVRQVSQASKSGRWSQTSPGGLQWASSMRRMRPALRPSTSFRTTDLPRRRGRATHNRARRGARRSRR